MLGDGLETQLNRKASWGQMKSEISRSPDGLGIIPRSLLQLFESLNSLGGGRSEGEARGGSHRRGSPGARGRKASVFDTKSIVASSPVPNRVGDNKGGASSSVGGEKFVVMCSYMQIYNDLLYDLLNDEQDKRGKPVSLTIRESNTAQGKNLYVQGLSEYR